MSAARRPAAASPGARSRRCGGFARALVTLAALSSVWAIVLASGCGGDPKYTLIVEVVSDDGKPLPGVKVKLGDGTSGTTDDLGQVRRRVAGEEGARFPVSVVPPTGYGAPAGADGAVVLRHLMDADGQGKKPIEYQVKLAPTTRTYAVLVRTSVPNLPVEAFGNRKAVTNRQGVAMFLYEGTPGEHLEVKLDTADRPTLSPANPVTSFVLPARQQAFVVKQQFIATVTRPSRTRPKIKHIGPRPL